VRAKLLIIVTAALVLGACTTKKDGIPGLGGPSGLALSLNITASPDQLTRDGVSTSVIEITATDANGNVIPDLTLQVAASNNLGAITTPSVKTNGSGKASTIYTAPGPGGTTTATITVTPSGTNYQNTTSRTIQIRLFQPPS
jgi:adhesin/invasin